MSSWGCLLRVFFLVFLCTEGESLEDKFSIILKTKMGITMSYDTRVSHKIILGSSYNEQFIVYVNQKGINELMSSRTN